CIFAGTESIIANVRKTDDWVNGAVAGYDCALLLDLFYKVAKDIEPETLTVTDVPTDDYFKQKIIRSSSIYSRGV
ncbi:7692_t:CDS:2, partial [Gigaspora margarita]